MLLRYLSCAAGSVNLIVTLFQSLPDQFFEFNGIEVGKAPAHAGYKKFPGQCGQFERFEQMLLRAHAPQHFDINIVVGSGFHIRCFIFSQCHQVNYTIFQIYFGKF
jgi:hypothetical protein